MESQDKITVIFIHGILSWPYFFHSIIKLVNKDRFNIETILLEKHDSSAYEFSKAKMKIWEKQVDEIVNRHISNNEKIIIVGHSMGCLFSLEQVKKHKEVIGLFLLNLPLYPKISKQLIKQSFQMIFPRKKELEDPYIIYTKKACSIKLTKNIFVYLLWIRIYLELFKKMKIIRNNYLINHENTICLYSKEDEMVSQKSYRLVEEKTNYQMIELSYSSHFYYKGIDFSIIEKTFLEFLNRFTKL